MGREQSSTDKYSRRCFFEIANGNAPGQQSEDQVSDPASGFALSPAEPAQNRTISTEEPSRSSVHAAPTSRGTAVRNRIRAISRCSPVFSNTCKSSPCHAERSSRIMVSDRNIGTALCSGTIPVVTGSLGAATFPGSSGFRARAFPSAIHDLSPICPTPAFRHPYPTSRRKDVFLRLGLGGRDRSNGRYGSGQSSTCEESGA